MIVEIPYCYRALVIMPRHRNSEYAMIKDGLLPLRIDEVDGDEAPVAAVMKRGEDEVRYRSHNGTLVRELSLSSYTQAHEHLTTENFQEVVTGLHNNLYSPRSPFIEYRTLDLKLKLNRRQDAREVLSHRRDKVEAEIRRKLAGAVFVDGVLHVRSSGPAWVLGTMTPRSLATDYAVWIEALDEFKPIPDHFRGDRLADALTTAQRKLKEIFGRVEGDIPQKGEIEVLIPEAFAADDDWQVLTAQAGKFLKDTGMHVFQWPREAADAYLDLRDAMRNWPEAYDKEAAEFVLRLRRECASRNLTREISTLEDGIERLGDRISADFDPEAVNRPIGGLRR